MSRMNVRKLIHLVQARPALWDQRHSDYNNKIYLKQMWEEIGERMGCPAEPCKLKWRSLRDAFRREIRKYQSRLNDPGIADKSIPKWFYYKELQFLTEHLSGLENLAECTQEAVEDCFNSFYVKREPELSDDDEITIETSDDILLTLTGNRLSDGESSKKSDLRYQTSESSQIEGNQFEKSLKYYKEGSKRSTDSLREDKERKRAKVVEKNQEGDSDYHFLMSLLPFLKVVPHRRKMFVRTQIQNIISEEMDNENPQI